MKYILFAFMAIFLTSCSAGVEPTDPIGLSAGFSYMSHFTSYWVWGAIGTVVAVGILYVVKASYEKAGGKFSLWHFFAMFIALALFLSAWLYAPSEVAWNTTVEQAARGVYIR